MFFPKILEKLVQKHVLKYLLDNRLLSEFQYGLLPGKSTHEVIFKTVKDIYSSLNQKKIMGMMFLDVAKAFNCISHDILFSKMKQSGFGSGVVKWFKSYLNRCQKVTIGSHVSDVVRVVNGIAQGTVLGPILFILYINDIFKCVNHVKMSLFADDCVIYLSGNNWTFIHAKIQQDFNNIIDWTLRNNLRLNANKTNCMIVGSRARLTNMANPCQLKYMNRNIKFVRHCPYLGIVLDNNMSLIPLVNNVKREF